MRRINGEDNPDKDHDKQCSVHVKAASRDDSSGSVVSVAPNRFSGEPGSDAKTRGGGMNRRLSAMKIRGQ
jgi:hypothetical protein